jgi:hypothetical protein
MEFKLRFTLARQVPLELFCQLCVCVCVCVCVLGIFEIGSHDLFAQVDEPLDLSPE